MGLYRHQIRSLLWSSVSFAVGVAAGVWISTHYYPSSTTAQQVPPIACTCDQPATCNQPAISKGTPLAPPAPRATRPAPKIAGLPAIDPGSQAALEHYIRPSLLGHHPKVKLGSPATLKEEYRTRHAVLYGVLTQQNYLPTRAKTLHDTWGRDLLPQQLLFYVGEDCVVPADLAHLNVVKLAGVQDGVYPPLKKAFAAMRHMVEHYLDDFRWLIRADDDMYARPGRLEDLLAQFDHEDIVVIGRPGIGAEAELTRLQLLPHEAYCMGGPAMIFSRGAMRAIASYLVSCYEAIVLHDNRTGVKWHDDDVEIGRCFSRFVDVQCSTSQQALDLFHYDYVDAALKPHKLWSLPSLRKAITVHPIKKPENMLAAHHFYKRMQFEEGLENLVGVAKTINEACKSLLPTLLPPYPSANCGVTVKSSVVEQTSLLYGPGNLLEGQLHLLPQPQGIPYYHSTTERFGLVPWDFVSPFNVYEGGGIGSTHSISPALNTEMKRVISLVASHASEEGLKLKEFLTGYTRYSPSGREYILNLLFEGGGSPPTQHHKRYRLLRALSPEVLSVEEHYFGPHPSIHMILPLTGGGGERLGDFMASFKTLVLEASEKVTLHIVAPDNGLEEAAKGAVLQHMGANPTNVVVTKVEGVDRVGAIMAAMRDLKEGSDLTFITDIHTRVLSWFFHSCRANTVAGKRVYFPIPFRTSELRTPPVYFAWGGDWEHHSFSHVCIYKSDFDSVGGYPGGAGHPMTLIERVVEHHMEVMRSPDTGVIHLSPPGTCRDLHRKKQHKCRMVQTMRSSENPDLVDYLIELEDAKGVPLSSL